jgi:hypothetical protein
MGLKYKQKCGVDLSASGREKWNMTTIGAEQEQHLALFNKFRHDESVVDRLRSLVSRNTKIIQKVGHRPLGSSLGEHDITMGA